MPWQELTQHVNDHTVMVRSRGGNEYPVETESERLNNIIYKQLINQAHDDKDMWVFVDFEQEDPVAIDFSRGIMPKKPPWEY